MPELPKISLISHPNKAMLKIILNRLKSHAEKIIAEEKAGFRAGMSTTEQIFNLRILCEKYLQHQQDLYHVFKKAFDRVWHAALWATIKKYNISTNLIQVIKNLYKKVTSAVLFNSSIRDWFRTTAGVRQGCLLSSTLNIFLERIMTDPLEDHEGTVSIGGREMLFIQNQKYLHPFIIAVVSKTVTAFELRRGQPILLTQLRSHSPRNTVPSFFFLFFFPLP